MTASPAQLRLMLLDGAIRFARNLQDGIEQSDHELAFTGSSRCRAIIMELLTGLDRTVDKTLCDRLASLYLFLYGRLVEAMTERDAPMVAEVIELLEFERETWMLAMARVEEEEGTATTAPATATASAAPVASGMTAAAHSPYAAPPLEGGSFSIAG